MSLTHKQEISGKGCKAYTFQSLSLCNVMARSAVRHSQMTLCPYMSIYICLSIMVMGPVELRSELALHVPNQMRMCNF